MNRNTTKSKSSPRLTALALALGAAAATALSSCASVTRGTSDGLEVYSDPPGATVEIMRTDRALTKAELKKNLGRTAAKSADKHFCGPLTATTPATFDLKRKGKYQVTIYKEGFAPHISYVTHKTSGGGAVGMAGNVLIGGLIGMGIDAASGATQDLSPNPVQVNLVKHPAKGDLASQ